MQKQHQQELVCAVVSQAAGEGRLVNIIMLLCSQVVKGAPSLQWHCHPSWQVGYYTRWFVINIWLGDGSWVSIRLSVAVMQWSGAHNHSGKPTAHIHRC
eukprot:6370805-Amphidinium_carterae.1